ncbi:MAG: D-tyrosyl-tRNA(Tyr) deacylase [Tissierellia bacterium]|jgi:D-tyrosyl-tRNA(Tyr) deacylase|nr:D-tyrosyl-tRNA(Tyr) deacylase [Tissierellia bacterium]
MIAIIQRVTYSRVTVEDRLISQIDHGLMVLLGVAVDDTDDDIAYMVRKLPKLRIFSDDNDKMNLSVQDVGGKMQLISQFTLLGDCRQGNRPSYITAARPDKATEYYERVVQGIAEQGVEVVTGAFGEHMQVELLNSGPVTIIMDSRNK